MVNCYSDIKLNIDIIENIILEEVKKDNIYYNIQKGKLDIFFDYPYKNIIILLYPNDGGPLNTSYIIKIDEYNKELRKNKIQKLNLKC